MIVATFHGPNHFVPNYDETTIEVFENVGHAISALFDRYDTGRKFPVPVRYLDGNAADTIFPFTELGDGFECYKLSEDSADNGSLAEEGVIEALSAVHLGVWDYRLTLMRPFGANGLATDGTVSIGVEKR